MAKNKEGTCLRRLEVASKNLPSFQRFFYVQINTLGVDIFFEKYMLIFFNPENRKNTVDRVSRIKANLEKFDDIIAQKIISSANKQKDDYYYSSLKKWLSFVEKGWPVNYIDIIGVKIKGFIPLYLITDKRLQ